jgi:hypothetical protein
MSMGTPPSSPYAQRLNTELGEDYEHRCNTALMPRVHERAAEWPALREFIERRAELARQTGRVELKTVACLFYSDDPLAITFLPFIVDGLVIWTRHMGPRGANVLMGNKIKRELGIGLGWIDGRVLLSGNLSYISGACACLPLCAP